MAGVLQSLHLIANAAVQEADEVEAVKLELQGAVEVQQSLPVCHSPPERGQKGQRVSHACIRLLRP